MFLLESVEWARLVLLRLSEIFVIDFDSCNFLTLNYRIEAQFLPPLV
jgi:hypothetical protein